MDLKNLKIQATFRIEPSAEGGFIARSASPGIPTIEGRTREEVQQKIREQAFHNLEAEFPVLKDILEKQLNSGSNGSSSTTLIVSSKGFGKQVIAEATPEQVAELAKEVGDSVEKKFPVLSRVLNVRQLVTTIQQKTMQGSNPGSTQNTISNSPIVPESSGRWLWVLLLFLLVSTVMFFLLHHH